MPTHGEPTPALSLQWLGSYRGHVRGLRHPSVMLACTLHRPWPEAAEQALRLKLQTHGGALPAAPTVHQPSGGPPSALAAQTVIDLSLALMHKAGWVLMNEAHVIPVQTQAPAAATGAPTQVHGLLLPCLHQQPRLAFAAVQAVADWLNTAPVLADTNSLALAETPAAPADVARPTPAQAERERRLQACLDALSAWAPSGKNTPYNLAAALDLGVPLSPVAGNCWQFGWGHAARRLDSSFTDVTPVIGTNLARNKFHAAQLLRRVGLPVPPQALVNSFEQALQAAEQLGWPVVTKPLDCDGGVGVSTDIRDADGLRAGFDHARRASTAVLVERHVPGDDYRLTVFQGEVVSTIWRQPGGITGDGVRSVAALLQALNQDPLRGHAALSPLRPIALDDEACLVLSRQGLDAHSVPAAGRFVRLRLAANVERGGRPVPAQDGVHPDNLALALQASEAFDLDWAGIDLLIPDIRRSWREGGAAICEINAQPQLGTVTQSHLYHHLLLRLLPQQGRIPVVVVLGAQAAAACSALMARAMHTAPAAGSAPPPASSLNGARGLGLATGQGAFVDGQQQGQTLDLFAACEALLGHRAVRALVVQVDDEQALAQGLPLDRVGLVWVCSGWPASPQPVTSLQRVLRHLPVAAEWLVSEDAGLHDSLLPAPPLAAAVSVCGHGQALLRATETLQGPPARAPAAPLPPWGTSA